ncbi:Trehalase [Mycena indigotica]|uniref:Trehalase n=1 Tax=Mycena indigotica TaxID=2126181 RepID=A0A8H6VRN7_9AGAR|nr:Trehalase [Mycena indigotica]KAF7291314.1 Trehalase [Mycena indigotica]
MRFELALLAGTSAAFAQSSVSQIVVSTAIASPSGSASTAVRSQAPLPPQQAWCPSRIFCAGPLLQTLNLAAVFSDPKTYVDKPTSKAPADVLSDFGKLPGNTSITEGDVVNFVQTDFAGEGQELQEVSLPGFTASPPFLDTITDPIVKGFAGAVHGIWPQLARGTNASVLCDGVKCESSLIPLNHTFVVPGGRFREQYYWDSFWIVEGLLESHLYEVAKDTLQNFMDELERFGFIPNGGRIYYLNRSQPPLFIQMLARYVAVSNDTSILPRALPLAERELTWWQTNRTVAVKSPFSNATHQMAQYNVRNTAPRPESYLQDYTTVHGVTPALNATGAADLYAELASGAETGWDYSSRWLTDIPAGLPSLNVRGIIPVDLNSILYKSRIVLAQMYGIAGSTQNADAANRHRQAAAALKAGIIDLFWNSSKFAFYDFNLRTNAQNTIWTAAHYYPFWSGIVPDDVLKSSDNAFKAFSSLNLIMNRYNGTIPTTFIETGLQWDAPNAWPPHQYIALQALKELPSNVTNGALPTPASGQNTFSLIPDGQLGLPESALPAQAFTTTRNATTSGAAADINKLDGTVVNGGKKGSGGWAEALGTQLANRYVASALCSWQATGGSVPNLIPRLSDAELNITESVTNVGNMFEKFSIMEITSAGRGGEYTVQAGFGWTNGVLLWVASNYAKVLDAPRCPPLQNAARSGGNGGNGGNGGRGNGAVGVKPAVGVVALVAAVAALVL